MERRAASGAARLTAASAATAGQLPLRRCTHAGAAGCSEQGLGAGGVKAGTHWGARLLMLILLHASARHRQHFLRRQPSLPALPLAAHSPEPQVPRLQPNPALLLVCILVAGQAALGAQLHPDAAVCAPLHGMGALPLPNALPGPRQQPAIRANHRALVPLLPAI